MNITVSYHGSCELIERSVWNTLASREKLCLLVQEHSQQLQREVTTGILLRKKRLKNVLCKKYIKQRIIAEKILPEAIKGALSNITSQLREQINSMVIEILQTVLQEHFSVLCSLSKNASLLLKKALRTSPVRIVVAKDVKEKLITAINELNKEGGPIKNLFESSHITPGDIEIYFSNAKVTSVWKREIASLTAHLTQQILAKLD